ncbi:hypothetical protein FJZ40_04840 [Candidatus Shapirobacteria bacterium]|nr:hypothetical protein [Candidatus Shapirobacteria bacterium]
MATEVPALSAGGRVGSWLEMAALLCLSRAGIPGSERTLGRLVETVRREGGVGPYVANKASLREGDRVRFHLLEEGLLLMYLAAKRRQPIPEVARDAIDLSLAEPQSRADPQLVHFPFLRNTYSFRRAADFVELDGCEPVEMLADLLPVISPEQAEMVFEDIFGFLRDVRMQQQEKSRVNAENVTLMCMTDDIISILSKGLRGGRLEESVAGRWLRLVVDVSDRFPQAGRESFCSLRTALLRSFRSSCLAYGNPARMIEQLGEGMINVFVSRHPAVMDEEILSFVQLAPYSPPAVSYLERFTNSPVEEQRLAAARVLLSEETVGMVLKLGEDRTKSQRLHSFIETLLSDTAQGVRTGAIDRISQWRRGVEAEFVDETLVRLLRREQASAEEKAAILGSIAAIVEEMQPDVFSEEMPAETKPEVTSFLTKVFAPLASFLSRGPSIGDKTLLERWQRIRQIYSGATG